MRRRAWLFVMLLPPLLGAGCRLDRNVDWKLPFSLDPSGDLDAAAAASASIALKPGLSLTIRPSTLGVSGSVDQVLGLDAEALEARVTEAGADRRVLEWQGASATGTLAFEGFADAKTMLLPAFWRAGDAMASDNGGLWLSRAAYDGLDAGRPTEWRLGVADRALSSLLSSLDAFNALSARLYGSATAVALSSPFSIEKTGEAETFPLTLDGKLTLVRVIQASSWFADLVILDNPDDPLILKVSVNPAAAPALRALDPGGVRSDELGYEITALGGP